MNWLPKKFLTSKLRNFFHIEDERNIEMGVSLLGKQQVKCTNLTLKPEAVNKPESIIHVRNCKISVLEIVFDRQKMAKEPLSVTIDRLKLTVMFNPDKKPAPKNPDKKRSRPKLDEFYKAIGSEEEYRERSFIQQQLFQIKRMFGQFFLGKLCLKITNIDVSVEYLVNDKPHYIGVSIQQIQLKERLVYKGVTSEEQTASEELHCLFRNIGIYFGAKYEESVVNRQAEHREVVRRVEKRNKKYIMSRQTINIYYSMEEKLLTVVTNELNFHFDDILIHEARNLVDSISTKTNNRPALRPGQGKIVNVGKVGKDETFYNQPMKVSEGTLLWWQTFGTMIIQKFNKRENLNILKNKKFRKYLFCLLYRFTFGAKAELEDIIDEYEYFKSDLQVMKYNQFIMEKVHRIRETQGVDLQCKGFIVFLNTIVRADEKLKKLKMKSIDYNQIKNSNVIVNIENCKKFINIQQTDLQDYLTISVKLQSFSLWVLQPTNYAEMKMQLDNLTPIDYAFQKKNLLDKYCNQLIMKRDEETQLLIASKTDTDKTLRKKMVSKRAYLQLTINKLELQYNSQGNIYIDLPYFLIKDLETQSTISTISGLSIVQENMHPEAYDWKIVTEQRMQIKVNLIYFNLECGFVEKLLNIKSYMDKAPIEVDPHKKNHLTAMMSKKVPNHQIFSTYSNSSKEVIINEVIIATPVFDKNRNFQFVLNGVEYNDPVNTKTSFGIERTLIERSNYQITNKKIAGNRRIKNNDQVLLMISTRPFSGYISRGHDQDITSILVPFILLQLSCQDMYYAANISKMWQTIFKNPYYFPPPILKRVPVESEIKPTAVNFAKKMSKIIEHKTIMEVKLEGIQFFLISDFVNENNNKIFDFLIDTISFETISTFSIDTMNISIKDIFVRNCLLGKKIDKQALHRTLRTFHIYDEEPILTSVGNTKNEGELLFCSDSPLPKTNQSDKPFVGIKKQSVVDLDEQKSVNKISIHTYPMMVFYPPVFADSICGLFAVIFDMASENIQEWIGNARDSFKSLPFFGKGMEKYDNMDFDAQEVEVLVAEQFQIVNKLSIVLDRMNLLIIDQGKVCYSISLGQIKVHHTTEPYINKFVFSSNRFTIVDTTETAGPYPILVDAKKKEDVMPITGSFTLYNSEIIRNRQNKSAYFSMKLNDPELFFLKKKVMEFINILMLVLNQTGILSNKPPEQNQNNQNNNKGQPEPGFRYLVQVVSPQIQILRSSLSTEYFNAMANSILVSNFITDAVPSDYEPDANSEQFLRDLSEFSRSGVMQEKFVLCEQVDEQFEVDFKSFEKENHQNAVHIDKIFIKLSEMHIFGFEQKKFSDILLRQAMEDPARTMIEIPEINMEFYNSQLDVEIASMFAQLEEEDYRVLIRITEQNFLQSPVLFSPPPQPTTPAKINFRTTFNISEFNMRINREIEGDIQGFTSTKTVELKMKGLKGKNEIWNNGENQTQLSLKNLDMLTSSGVRIIFNRYEEKDSANFQQINRKGGYTNLSLCKEIKKMESDNKKLQRKVIENQGAEYMQMLKGGDFQDVEPEKDAAKKQTNTERICKWVKGMCKKCWGNCMCCKKGNQDNEPNRQVNEILKLVAHEALEVNELIPEQMFISGEKDPMRTVIYEVENILGFSYGLDQNHIRAKKKEDTMVYLDFSIKPSGEKHMYLQSKRMCILMEKTKSLFDAIAFFNKPYANPENPSHIRRPQFNNNKGFRMVIELNDSIVQMKNEEEGKEEKITLLLDSLYDSENRGDTTFGPGRSRLKIQSLVKIIFSSEFASDPIQLSDTFKLAFHTQNIVPYGQNKKNRNTQRILLSSENGDLVGFNFYIPAWIIKSIMRINSASFGSQDQGNVSRATTQNQSRKKSLGDYEQDTLMRKKMSEDKNPSLNEEEGMMNLKVVEPVEEQKKGVPQPQKKDKKPPPQNQKSAFISKCIYIPQIQINLQAKNDSSFIRVFLSEARISQFSVGLNANNSFVMRHIKAKLQVDYWNLKLGLFQPCLQPWNFKMDQTVNTRDQISSSNIKISSDIDSWQIQDEKYVNDLNINISLALFQTYKELMIKYEQEDYEQDEICLDLTASDENVYNNLFSDPKRFMSEIQPRKIKNFPNELKTYFGRKFVIDENYSIRKKSKMIGKGQFNPPKMRIFVYHSYFDHFRRRKRITYRTPFRIFNATGITLNLWFFISKNHTEWMIKLKKCQYYAIPSKIYSTDFVVSINEGTKDELSPQAKFVSVMYLLQTTGKQKNFERIYPTKKIWKSIFQYSSHNSQKWLDPRDVVLRIPSEELSFAAVTFKSSDKLQVDIFGGGKGSKLYDSYTIILSPITIQNYTYYDFWIKVNRRQRILIGKNSKVEINQYLSEEIEDTVVEFEDDSLHQEFQFLNMEYGETKKIMEINKLQSIRMLISRETVSTCFVELYADWNISNLTNEDFIMRYGGSMFLLDKSSFSCISNITGKNIDISIVGEEHHAKKLKPSNLMDDLVLSKKIPDDKHRRIYPSILQHQKARCCACLRHRRSIFQHIQFVFHATDDPLYQYSKKIEIKYKYQIRNQTNNQLKLFQYKDEFLIATLPHYNASNYIFYYEQIPKHFFLQLLEPGTNNKLNTCLFSLEEFPGTSFALKVKKSNAADVMEYHKQFHYLRVQIKKNEEQTIIDIMEANNNFPIYMDNLTDYSIKITESEDEFILKPHQRIPLAWSKLILDSEKGYKLEVKIDEAEPKTFWFNKKSTFDPIKIMGNNQNKKKRQENFYMKENCYVEYEYMGISGICLLILDLFDNKLRIHNNDDSINMELEMQDVQKMEILASKIQLNFSDSRQIQIIPSSKTIKNWIDALHSCINENVIDSVFFTIEVYKNSRIFFFRTIKEQDYQSNKQQYSISHLNISLVTSMPQEVILLYLNSVSYSQHQKISRLNYQKYDSNQTEKVITIKKLKINNQTQTAINPVVMSQIKKSNHPFLELRICQQKLYLKEEVLDKMSTRKKKQVESEEERILHYKQIVFFVDEAELMVEYSLFVDLLQVKNNFTYITNQYAVGQQLPEDLGRGQISTTNQRLVELNEDRANVKNNPQVYINYLEIKPIKMTISVSLEHSRDEEIKLDLIGVLRYIPFGVQNAIIEIPSYQYTHIYYDQQELNKKFRKYYEQSIYNQLLSNAGSYDLLMPIKLLTGLGTGVKNIFYDPFYELVRKKEIKAGGKAFCEGLISLIVFLITFLIKLISLVFKIISMLSFDQEFKTKRQSFRKQIFKSPVDAAILGAKNWWNTFKSFFVAFSHICQDYQGYLIFGYIFGFFACLFKIIFWIPKVICSTYDFIYVIGMGIVNWGYYEDQAMKNKSRPRRTFPQKHLTPYNYLYAYGNQIIQKDQLNQVENQEILFVKPVQINDENNHLILSNYRILYNNSKLTSCTEIKLYQISQVKASPTPDGKRWMLMITLSIPNTHKVLLCFSYSQDTYVIHFHLRYNLIKFLKRLRMITSKQKLATEFIEAPELKHQIEDQELIVQGMLGIKQNSEEDMI